MKKGIPKVSVAIVAYNQEGFIEEAVRSAADQNYDNLEIIIADDGSTDKTSSILNMLQIEYGSDLIKIIRGNNLGVTGNSNRALNACKGDFIAFQGGDDVLLPGKIHAQAHFMQFYPDCSLSYHEAEVFDDFTDDTLYYFSQGQEYEGNSQTVIENGTFFTATTVMVRNSCIPENGFDTRIKVASDWLFWVQALQKCNGQIMYLPGVYARHRRHDHNVTRRQGRVKFDEHWLTLQILAESQLDNHNLKYKIAEIALLEAFQEYKAGNLNGVMRSLGKCRNPIQLFIAFQRIMNRKQILDDKKARHRIRKD